MTSLSRYFGRVTTIHILIQLLLLHIDHPNENAKQNGRERERKTAEKYLYTRCAHNEMLTKNKESNEHFPEIRIGAFRVFHAYIL